MKYYVKTSKESFFKNFDNIKKTNSIRKLKVIDNHVEFYTNKIIDIEEFENINLFTRIIKKLIIPNLIFIIGIFLMFGIIITTPYYIREIKYDKNSIKDEAVLEYVNNHLNESLLNQRLSVNLNDLSKKLSIVFSHYAFIGLKKIGSVIYINIEMEDNVPNQIDLNNRVGDFVSKYDAYIEEVIIEKGQIVSTINNVVKKGDLLVSGNLKYFQNIFDSRYYVSPKGIIIGNVIEFKKIQVNKKVTNYCYNGKTNKYKKYLLFGKILNNHDKKENSVVSEEIIFKIGEIFKVISVTEYEKERCEFYYDDTNIQEYCHSMIYYEFEKERVSDKEKINSVTLLKINQNKDEYNLLFLINKSINIVVFKEYQ